MRAEEDNLTLHKFLIKYILTFVVLNDDERLADAGGLLCQLTQRYMMS